MGAKKVYLVHCPEGLTLKVSPDGGGKQVSMDVFLQTHTPIQVTGLTPSNPGNSVAMIGLMIAEDKEAEAAGNAEKKPPPGVWGT